MKDEYFLGGYLLTARAKRVRHASPDLFPPKILSASRCVAEIIPDFWYGDWSGEAPPKLVEPIQNWVKRHWDIAIGPPDLFFSLEAAREFATAFYPERTDLLVLGMGLNESLVAPFLADNDLQRPGEGAETMCRLIRGETPLAPGGTPAGFEPLGQEYSNFHSWLCIPDNQEHVPPSDPALRPNADGLIDTFAAARHLSDLCYLPSQVDFYLPWLLVHYPLR